MTNSFKLLSFAGLEPGIYQSGTMLAYGKMVKRGSRYLRGALMNISNIVIKYNSTFYDYYLRNVLKVNVIELLYLMFIKNFLELFTN